MIWWAIGGVVVLIVAIVAAGETGDRLRREMADAKEGRQ